mmetsp:Transcript_16346/g.24619  ORF Transcript_16346/g.24619 Transcript_16346/m.24619 type:complete len:298 (+) Transcript_16346:98-991(+)
MIPWAWKIAHAMLKAFFAGVLDSFQFHNVLVFIVSSGTIRQNSFMCVALNLLIFIGSYYMLDLLILPLLRAILMFDGNSLFPYDGEDAILIEKMFFWLYQILWLYPIYALSNILSTIWYQAIVDAAYLLVKYPQAQRNQRVRQMDFVSEKIYNFFLTLGLYLQMFAVSFIPLVGSILCFVHVCWLYSLYSFDYKWDKEGRRLDNRLQYFEERWAYFLGFGFPLAIVTAWFPWLVAYGLYAFSAPAFIMLAITAVPVNHVVNKDGEKAHGLRLPIYTIPKLFANWTSLVCCGGSADDQ